MIRIVNVALIAMTGLACLGLYRIAEEARVADAELRATRAAIQREQDALTVLGAEWAQLTQPGRIQKLAERHLDLSDRPEARLSSLTQLPPKDAPLASAGEIRNAKAVVPQPHPQGPIGRQIQPARPADAAYVLIHTGT